MPSSARPSGTKGTGRGEDQSANDRCGTESSLHPATPRSARRPCAAPVGLAPRFFPARPLCAFPGWASFEPGPPCAPRSALVAPFPVSRGTEAFSPRASRARPSICTRPGDRQRESIWRRRTTVVARPASGRRPAGAGRAPCRAPRAPPDGDEGRRRSYRAPSSLDRKGASSRAVTERRHRRVFCHLSPYSSRCPSMNPPSSRSIARSASIARARPASSKRSRLHLLAGFARLGRGRRGQSELRARGVRVRRILRGKCSSREGEPKWPAFSVRLSLLGDRSTWRDSTRASRVHAVKAEALHVARLDALLVRDAKPRARGNSFNRRRRRDRAALNAIGTPASCSTQIHRDGAVASSRLPMMRCARCGGEAAPRPAPPRRDSTRASEGQVERTGADGAGRAWSSSPASARRGESGALSESHAAISAVSVSESTAATWCSEPRPNADDPPPPTAVEIALAPVPLAVVVVRTAEASRSGSEPSRSRALRQTEWRGREVHVVGVRSASDSSESAGAVVRDVGVATQADSRVGLALEATRRRSPRGLARSCRTAGAEILPSSKSWAGIGRKRLRLVRHLGRKLAEPCSYRSRGTPRISAAPTRARALRPARIPRPGGSAGRAPTALLPGSGSAPR